MASSLLLWRRQVWLTCIRIAIVLVVTTTAVPCFVSPAAFLSSRPTRFVGPQYDEASSPFVVTSSFLPTRAFEAASSAASSSSSSLNAGTGKGFQQPQQQQQVQMKEHSFENDKKEPLSGSSSSTTTTTTSNSIYSKPALYDLAFGFRDYAAQVDFLLAQHAKYSKTTAMSSIATTTATSSTKSNDNDDSREHNSATAAISVLFLGAGPARHAFIALNNNQNQHHHNDMNHHLPRVVSVTCIDNCREMVDYSKGLAVDELEQRQQQEPSSSSSSFRYLLADMRDFASALRHVEEEDDEHEQNSSDDAVVIFDTAWILMGSLQHLATNAEVLQCFRQVATCLHPGGTLVLELPHPKEELLGGMVDCTRNSWQVPLADDHDSHNDAGQLDILWGDDNDEFDAISQIRKLTVSLELKETITVPPTAASSAAAKQKMNGKKKKNKAASSANANTKIVQSVRQVIPVRLFTAQEIDALATCAGFQVVAMAGALEEDISVHDDAAYRLVCILRKL